MYSCSISLNLSGLRVYIRCAFLPHSRFSTLSTINSMAKFVFKKTKAADAVLTSTPRENTYLFCNFCFFLFFFFYYLIIFIGIKYCRAQIQIQLQNRQICVHLRLEYLLHYKYRNNKSNKNTRQQKIRLYPYAVRNFQSNYKNIIEINELTFPISLSAAKVCCSPLQCGAPYYIYA